METRYQFADYYTGQTFGSSFLTQEEADVALSEILAGKRDPRPYMDEVEAPDQFVWEFAYVAEAKS